MPDDTSPFPSDSGSDLPAAHEASAADSVSADSVSEALFGRVQGGDAESEAGPTAKEQIETIIRDQPDDSTYDEILRELALHRMIVRGASDLKRGRVLDDAVLRARVRGWQS